MSAHPITILIGALGGEGGGVLAGWITEAAVEARLEVVRTSVPGVAQRTGATTYYLEIMNTPRLGGAPQAVLSLLPAPGAIDLAIATEWVEAGRLMLRGFVTPQRTTLIASTHRAYTVEERMHATDGRYDSSRIRTAADALARRKLLFDLAKRAAAVSAPANAMLLGAVAESGVLPMAAQHYHAAIRAGGRSVEANLRGFEAGRALVAEASASPRSDEATPTAALRRAVLHELPEPSRSTASLARVRLEHYQDARYAHCYVTRLKRLADVPGIESETLDEAARHLALAMSYEDVVRVAQLKTQRGRVARLRAETGVPGDALVHVTEFLSPGIEELESLLPATLARAMSRFRARSGTAGALALQLRSTSLSGFLLLRTLAAMRRLRRSTLQFREVDALLSRWLDDVAAAVQLHPALARESVRTISLVTGYGDTRRRGLAHYEHLRDGILAPALARRMDAAVAAELLRRELDQSLAHGAPSGDTRPEGAPEIRAASQMA